MKSTNDFQTSNPEMVTISRAEYEEKNARLASQDERISRLESQIELLTEALRLARHSKRSTISTLSQQNRGSGWSPVGGNQVFLWHSSGSFSDQGSRPSRKSMFVSSICFGISVSRCFRYS